MKIVRERPCQRRHHRVKAPLFVEFQGIVHRAADWSLGGLRIDQFSADLPAVDTEISLTLSLPFQGFEVVYPVRARVVRIVEETATFAVEFTDLGERERNLMEHFIEQLIRGSMMPVEDTIQRIDVPVTPVSTEPDVNPSATVPLRRWPAKTVLMTSLYMILGLFIISYVGLMIYANYFRLEIQTAVVTVPIETSITSVDGMVIRVDAEENQSVRAGQPLIWIEDPRLERDITVVEAEVERRRADLELNRQNLANALRSLAEFIRTEAVITPFDGRFLEIVVEIGGAVQKGDIVAWLQDPNLERQIAIAEAEVGRRRADLEQAQRKLISVRSQIAEYKRIDENEIKKLKFQIESLLAKRAAAQAARNRLLKLLNKGYTTRSQFEEVDAKYQAAAAELSQRQVQLRERVELAEMTTVRYYNGDRFVADLDELKSLVNFAEDSLNVAQDKRGVLIAQRQRMAVTAPFEGVVKRYLKTPDTPIIKGDPLVVIERKDDAGFASIFEILGSQDAGALRDQMARFDANEDVVETSAGVVRDGEKLLTEVQRWRAKVDFADETLLVAGRKYRNLIGHREKLVILAPYDGILRTILKQPGSAVVKGDGLAIFERNSESVIEAYLNQEEVLQVGLGDEALVYLPALNRRITATVVDVDRTSAFVDEQRSKYTWRGPKDRTALVTLAFNAEQIPPADLTGGLPAVVIFERQYTSELIEGITGRVDVIVEDIRESTFPEARAEPDDSNEFRR